MVKNSGITPKQRRAISLLVTGRSARDIAAAIGVHENTIYMWGKTLEFQAALHEAENEAMRGVTRSLLALADKATGTLESVMDNARALDSSKVRAADIVIGRLLQTRELLELEERIKRLEDQIGQSK